MTRRTWFVPLAVIGACIPCLLLPLGFGLFAAGAFGGALGFLGVPWVLAAVAVVVALLIALVVFRPQSCPPREADG